MKRHQQLCLLIMPVLVGAIFLWISLGISKAVTEVFQMQMIRNSPCIIIDPGHGGEDGGAVSCTGVCESEINLQISQRINMLFQLLGFRTKLLRDSNCALYTTGDTIRAKKISDLKERVRLVNETDAGILLSIHQNTFTDPKYYGAQVFYANGCQNFAEFMQNAFLQSIQSESNRKAKKGTGIYVLDHITRPGILIECGFLSNPIEEEKLRNAEYQEKLAEVITAAASVYICNSKT